MRKSGQKWCWRVGQGLGHRNSVRRVWDLGRLSGCDGNQWGLRLRNGRCVALQSSRNYSTEEELEEAVPEVSEGECGAPHVSKHSAGRFISMESWETMSTESCLLDRVTPVPP